MHAQFHNPWHYHQQQGLLFHNLLQVCKVSHLDLSFKISCQFNLDQLITLAPTLPSVAEHLDGINPDEFLNDFTGTVQNNTCNSTQSTCNHASDTRPQIFYGNVTVIHNLTINKLWTKSSNVHNGKQLLCFSIYCLLNYLWYLNLGNKCSLLMITCFC